MLTSPNSLISPQSVYLSRHWIGVGMEIKLTLNGDIIIIMMCISEINICE